MSQLAAEEENRKKEKIEKITLVLPIDWYSRDGYYRGRIKTEVECNSDTAKEVFKPNLYQLPDGRTHKRFACEECEETIIEYEDGRRESRKGRGCPFLKREEEIQTAANTYSYFDWVHDFKKVRKIKYVCMLHNLKREVKLM
jgi:hypothetical protein